jgi:hypothetical protein
MWMVDPVVMCRQHLLGEHKEIHQLIGSINAGISIEGYYQKNIIQLNSIKYRHYQLVQEMKKRGYNHNSPLPAIEKTINKKYYQNTVNRQQSFSDLISRCPECKKLAFIPS